MAGCLDYNVFAALLDGSLSQGERRQALTHIARCAACRSLANDLGYEVPVDPALVGTEVAQDADNPVLPNPATGPRQSDPALAPTAAAPAKADPRGGYTMPGSGEFNLGPARLDVATSDPRLSPNQGGAGQASPVSVPGQGEPLIGRVIAGYRVQRELGHGGMGAVYEAVHERMGQRAAVKVMFSEFCRDPGFIRRFRDEARAASLVHHPGLVTIFNHGQLPDGTAYIMMEYLEGESLGRRLQRRRLKAPEALRLVRQIASALCAVHEQGIVHRDLKPDNVMIIPDADLPAGERAKVVDFGIAKLDAKLRTHPSMAGAATGQQSFVGTVAYASPEQCRMSSTVDGKSDVYSLGVIFYEMLGGDIPFSGSVSEVLGMHIGVEPRPLRELVAEVPPTVAALVHAMLVKSPRQRPSMVAVRDRIDQMESAIATKQPRRPLFLGAAVVALLGTALALLRHFGLL